MSEKVTGKQILCEFAALAKDIGIYLYGIGKRVVCSIKCALSDKCDKDKACDQKKTAAASAQKQ